jgi:hypothetical protein
MARSSYVNIAKPARKRSSATGTLVGVRLQDDELKAIDSWARKQEPPVTRPYAIRCLVELGLSVKTKSAPSERQRADLADLASKAIDSVTVSTADTDEKAGRKRSLLTGPEEFREVRVDRPGKKRS